MMDSHGDTRVFVIAEAGVNHNGDVALARALIDVAHKAGADAVKFQTFTAASLAVSDAPMAEYQKAGSTSDSSFEMLRRLELSMDDFVGLKSYCDQVGIAFLSTPFDLDAAQRLAALDMTVFKIPSGEITNAPFIRGVARLGHPIILSTGMSDLADVEAAVGWIEAEGGDDITLLHCVSNYPAPPEAANLRAMDTLAAAFGRPIGWSDHTLGDAITLAAVARGARVIEKHFTLDKAMPGPDHAMSLDPEELSSMVRRIRDVEASLGDGRKRPTPAEAETRLVARRSLFLAGPVQAGQPLRASDLIALRPGDGMSPGHSDVIIGRLARRNLAKGEKLAWTDVD